MCAWVHWVACSLAGWCGCCYWGLGQGFKVQGLAWWVGGVRACIGLSGWWLRMRGEVGAGSGWLGLGVGLGLGLGLSSAELS